MLLAVAVRHLFTLAIFASATLLFILQPLVGKILLPVLGGSPAVWSTCMVFFQAVLLLGYLYAHALSSRVASRWQWLVHAGVLVGASVVLPLPVDVGEPGTADPRWWAVRVLAATVGLPFFALSATAPLLQHWFSRTSDRSARDPYFLYAASNAGSLLGLLGYLLVEPFASRTAQAAGWAAGFWAVASLIIACAYAGRSLPAEAGSHSAQKVKRPDPVASGSRKAAAVDETRAGSHTISRSRRGLWVVLALVPSTLLLGVTQHLATDVVSAPLLWVVPLTLYLSTFMAAFSTRGFGSARRWGAVAPVVAVLVLVLSLAEIR